MEFRPRQPTLEIPYPKLSSDNNYIPVSTSPENGKHHTTHVFQAADYLNTYSGGFRFILALICFFLRCSLMSKLNIIRLKFFGEAVNAGKLQSEDIAELCDLILLSPQKVSQTNNLAMDRSAGKRIFEQTI